MLLCAGKYDTIQVNSPPNDNRTTVLLILKGSVVSVILIFSSCFLFWSLQVGGTYSYDCSFGYIPNVELMKFISLATFGTYLSNCPEVDENSQDMNVYHKAFLTYSFLKTPESLNSEYFYGETFFKIISAYCIHLSALIVL